MPAKNKNDEQKKEKVVEEEVQSEAHEDDTADVTESQTQEETPEETPEENHADYTGWIKMSHKEMLLAQESGVLCGYNPHKHLGLVKIKETKAK